MKYSSSWQVYADLQKFMKHDRTSCNPELISGRYNYNKVNALHYLWQAFAWLQTDNHNCAVCIKNINIDLKNH